MKRERIREPDVDLLNAWRPGILTDAVLISIQSPGELMRTNHPCAMARGAVVFGLMKNRTVRGGIVLPSDEARRTTSPLTVAMKTLGMGALFDVARNVMTFNFAGILATEHYVDYEFHRRLSFDPTYFVLLLQ